MRLDEAMASSTAIKNVINGKLVPAKSGKTYDVFDPSTGKVYASAPLSGPEDVDLALKAASTASAVLIFK